jgi:hypothetical protein
MALSYLHQLHIPTLMCQFLLMIDLVSFFDREPALFLDLDVAEVTEIGFCGP